MNMGDLAHMAAARASSIHSSSSPDCSRVAPGTNCIKIGLPGKLILSKRKGVREVLFS